MGQIMGQIMGRIISRIMGQIMVQIIIMVLIPLQDFWRVWAQMLLLVGGVDFNQIAGETAFNTSLSIDGVNVSASTTTDNSTDTNTNNGSYGSRGMFNIITFGLLIILVSCII